MLASPLDSKDAVQETFIRVSWLSGMDSSQVVSGRVALEWGSPGRWTSKAGSLLGAS